MGRTPDATTSGTRSANMAPNRVNVAFVLICLAFASANSEEWLQDEWLQEDPEAPTPEAAAPWVMTGGFKGKEWCWENLVGAEGLDALADKVTAKEAKKGRVATFSTPTNTGQDCTVLGYTHAAWGGKKGGNGVTGELGNKRFSKLLEDDKFFEALLQEDPEAPTPVAAAPYVMTGGFKGKEWCWENLVGPKGLTDLAAKVTAKKGKKWRGATFSTPINTGDDCTVLGYTHAAWGGKKGGNGVTGELGNKRFSKLLEDEKFFEALLQEDPEAPTPVAAAPYVMTGGFKGKEWCWENLVGPKGLTDLAA